MKKLLFSILAAGIMALNACPPKNINAKPEEVHQKGEWLYKVWVVHKGTRSEGHYAHLYKNGEEVCQKKKKKEIITPFGIMIYFNSKHVWGWHGWRVKSQKRVLIGG